MQFLAKNRHYFGSVTRNHRHVSENAGRKQEVTSCKYREFVILLRVYAHFTPAL